MGGCLSTSSNSERLLQIRPTTRTRSKGSFREQILNFQDLPSIHNRFATNGKSRSSCIFTQQGQKGINQDAMVVWEDFISEDAVFCGIFDGHGPQGHLVARRVRDTLPFKLLSSLQSHNSRGRGGCFSTRRKRAGDPLASVKGCSSEDPLIALWREAFYKSYKSVDKELRSHPSVDCFCSGSTAVTLVKHGLNLFIGNIGDSRAVLGSRDANDSMVAVQLTVDLKPNLPREAERIKKCKGRVFALQDEPEVHRVWLPNDDAPGLAMARAFGDFCLKNYGVISVPEFSHRILTERDQFIVLASDGVWDVMSNEEVVEVVSSAPNRTSAARILINYAVREWKLKYPTSKVDDCAVICLFLDGKMDSESEPEEMSLSAAATNYSCNSGLSESDDVPYPEPSLQRNYTIRPTDDDTNCMPHVANEGDDVLDQNWLGLEGVTRVNSLVQLPRFSQEKTNADLGLSGR